MRNKYEQEDDFCYNKFGTNSGFELKRILQLCADLEIASTATNCRVKIDSAP
jgi:hypothetical protein